jgi:type I restriction enzyme, S subunit
MKLLEHFKELTTHPKNAQELKGLILKLAIEGKLTKKWREENPDVEPAKFLLERIRAENTYSKNIKNLIGISSKIDSNIANSFPSTWEYCRLGEIIQISSGDGLVSNQMIFNGGIPVYGGNGITGYHDKFNIDQKTIVIGRVGYYCGSIHISEEKAWVTDNAFITKYSKENIFFSFLFWLLKGTNLKEDENATAQPVISGKKIYPIIVFLPPLEEQKAIVAVVEELFKEIEELELKTKERIRLKEDYVNSALQQLANGDTEAEWFKIQEHFKIFFTEKSAVKKLRETILQLAVQGKLTKHWRSENPNQEHAKVLLEKIKAEKAQLTKDKKIKPEKPLPAIKKEEMPYELPEGWVWCRMQDIGLFERGKSKHRPRNDFRLFSDGKYPLVQTGDISSAKENGGIINTFKSLYNDFGLAQSKMWHKGTLCITIAANIAETGMLGFDACFPDSVVGFTELLKGNLSAYVEYFITIMKSDLEKYAPSTAQKNINLGILYELKFPLPPLKEQEIIIEIVNSLMQLCDVLEKEIEQNTEQVEALMKSCVREVLEF